MMNKETIKKFLMPDQKTTENKKVFTRKMIIIAVVFAVLLTLFAALSPFIFDIPKEETSPMTGEAPSVLQSLNPGGTMTILIVIERFLMIFPVVWIIYLLRKRGESLSALGLKRIGLKKIGLYLVVSAFIVAAFFTVMDFAYSFLPVVESEPSFWSKLTQSKEEILNIFPKEWNWTASDIKGFIIPMTLFIAIVTFLVALTEELFFRGVLQSVFMQWFKPGISILLSSFIFGFGHIMYWIMEDYNFNAFPIPQFITGLLLGWLYWKYKNIWLPVAVHLWANFLPLLLMTIAWLIVLR